MSDDFGITPFPIMEALLKEYPDIESGVSLYQLGQTTLNYEGKPLPGAEMATPMRTRAPSASSTSPSRAARPKTLDEPDSIVMFL